MMGASLIPSRQFCPATATSSTLLERFHFRSIRYNSYFFTDNQISRACNHIPYRESSPFVLRKKPSCLYKSPSVGFCCKSNNWVDHWNVPKHKLLPKQPRSIVHYRKGGIFGCYGAGRSEGSSTMDRIVEKLKKFGYIDDANENREKSTERRIEKGSIEDIFYVEEGMLPNARGGFSKESPLGAEDVFRSKDGVIRFPWEKQREKEEKERDAERNKGRTCLAELTLPESEWRRLRNLSVRMKNKTKISGAGVTEAVVETIHEKWKNSEIVKLKIEGPPALNMKRMHEILERKTGGLVIWRSGTSVSLYRGVSYEVPSVKPNKQRYTRTGSSLSALSTAPDETSKASSKLVPYKDINDSMESTSQEKDDTESFHEVSYEDEVDRLLDGLGPRYTDWPGDDPLPVDADMLPGLVPGYEPPFRILPYGVRSSLNHKEGTALRRLARVLPPHFALGRSRQLQGLAVAMIKLWEKSSIAKVALKRGVQLTTSERMAEDIKKLTGGILLSRNKDFLVFYRGKNFLSRDVTEALLERERLAKALQDEEEFARRRATALISPGIDAAEQSGTTGTLGETLDANSKWGRRLDDHEKEKVLREAEVARHANLLRKLERKLAFAERKLEKAEKALSKVEEFLKPAEQQADPESITDEERFMLRKLGLRMKAFLLLGRRGVFDGTVENMHLHWKYRELVKILVKAKTFDEVKKVALALEAESGGILVSVDRISKGYAIVVFRGKDYQRPSTLRPKNLLTKRKALSRSIELQRREALYNHISTLQRNVDKFRSQLEQMDLVKDKGDEKLYEALDDTYSTEDEDDYEDEGEEAFLPSYDSENDGEDESSSSIQNFHPDMNLPHDEFETNHALPEPDEHVADEMSSSRKDEEEVDAPECVDFAYEAAQTTS